MVWIFRNINIILVLLKIMTWRNLHLNFLRSLIQQVNPNSIQINIKVKFNCKLSRSKNRSLNKKKDPNLINKKINKGKKMKKQKGSKEIRSKRRD